jgi:P4 family phage/plasmid primase-like protien
MTLPCPITYHPEARPKCFLGFLEDSCSNDDDRMTLVDWLVACSILAEFEYLLFLLGHGSNGKHVYEAVLQALFGSDATEAIGLEELTSSKFAMGYLRRARLCISTETNPGRAATELIKKISGNDWLSSDVKNKDRIRFKAFTQLIFDSNSMPIFEDNSDGFRRRFTKVNMPYKFCDNPDSEDVMQKKADRHLLEKLTSEEELSGILNLIILRAKDIVADKKIHRRENDYEEYEKQSMSVTDFIECFIDFHPEFRDLEDYQLSADYLYSKFEEYKKYTIGAGISRKMFSKMIGRYNEEPSRTIRILKMPVRGFRGLLFEEDRFNAFIGEKKALYNTNILSNDSSVTKEKIVITNNDSSKDSCNDVTNVTIFRQYLMILNHDNIVCKGDERSIDTEIVTKPENQQPTASFAPQDGQIVTIENRSDLDEEGEWYDCNTCGLPLPPSKQSTYRGEIYCPSCIKTVLDKLAED